MVIGCSRTDGYHESIYGLASEGLTSASQRGREKGTRSTSPEPDTHMVNFLDCLSVDLIKMIGRYIYITAAAVSPRCDTLLLCRRRRHHMSSLSYLHTSYVVCCIVRASSSPLHPSAVCIREVFLEQVGGVGALLRVADVTPTASEDRNRHTRGISTLWNSSRRRKEDEDGDGDRQ